jgi:hypothetical protein
MLFASRTPSAETRREMARMVLEKAGAAVSGAYDGQKAALDLTIDALSGKLRPAEFATAPATIAMASLRPAFHKVRSNAKRLSRRRISAR